MKRAETNCAKMSKGKNKKKVQLKDSRKKERTVWKEIGKMTVVREWIKMGEKQNKKRMIDRYLMRRFLSKSDKRYRGNHLGNATEMGSNGWNGGAKGMQ